MIVWMEIDRVGTDRFLSFTCSPFHFKLFFAGAVDNDESECVIRNGAVKFTLRKRAGQHVLWKALGLPGGTIAAEDQLRISEETTVEHHHEGHEEKGEEKGEEGEDGAAGSQWTPEKLRALEEAAVAEAGERQKNHRRVERARVQRDATRAQMDADEALRLQLKKARQDVVDKEASALQDFVEGVGSGGKEQIQQQQEQHEAVVAQPSSQANEVAEPPASTYALGEEEEHEKAPVQQQKQPEKEVETLPPVRRRGNVTVGFTEKSENIYPARAPGEAYTDTQSAKAGMLDATQGAYCVVYWGMGIVLVL